MGSQRFVFTLIGLFVLSPLSVAEDATAEIVVDQAAEVAAEKAGDDNWMDERIQKFRETIHQRKQDASAAAEQVQPDAVTPNKPPADVAAAPVAASSPKIADKATTSAPAAVEVKQETDAQVSAADKRRQHYREAMDKQREARQAQARERRAARELQHKAQMERWLQQQEERQQQAIARHEAMRNQAEEEHNFLVQNHDDMLQKALQEKVDVANRHEERRKEADQRRKKFAAFRTAIKNMTPTERREYMDKHREELFSGDASTRPPAMPAPPPRFGGMHNQPPAPPWYR
jgi:hypothetical protein